MKITLDWLKNKNACADARNRIAVGYVGEDGIKADTWYRVETGKLVEAQP